MSLESLLTGENAPYIDALYQSWLQDPGSVDPEWATLFEAEERPAGPSARPNFASPSIFSGGLASPGAGGAVDHAAADLQAKVAQLINSYRVRGHVVADIDPLGRLNREEHPELSLRYYGLTEADLDKTVATAPLYGIAPHATVREIVDHCRQAYCSSFGVEYMNIPHLEQKLWLAQRLETLRHDQILDAEGQERVLTKLSEAEAFENMLHTKFPGTKRFSLEGGETLIPLMDNLVEYAAELGMREVIVGMAHRGRLNTLVNIFGKPPAMVVQEFQGKDDKGGFEGSGDVKYHLGYSTDRTLSGGKSIHLNMAFNPSHLEIVNPVVVGRVRAKQDRHRYDNGDDPQAVKLCMGLLLHGDAAFAGQGVVAETLNLSDLSGYRTGGTVHVVVNNQIGFTTSPKDARSTPYATDVARMLGVPIFHVNGEDPEAVAAVTKIAVEWRQRYHRDVVIDMLCFRKYGHNEGDEPSFTQPLEYKDIKAHATARQAYARKLVATGKMTQARADEIHNLAKERMNDESTEGAQDSYTGNVNSKMGQLWKEYKQPDAPEPDTGYPLEQLRELLVKANTLPDDFNAHRKVQRLLSERMKVIDGERPMNWDIGEQAAYATLCAEGIRVRLSGQDSGRGTFSHRHANITDVKTGESYFPLDHVKAGQARFQVMDSLLSEAAVLGFEFGYSLDYPDALVLWEAQFGDFANGAQVVVDQFIAATEQKWNRCTGVVMLLPHGFEHQGPEHSSARIERYMLLVAEDNMTLANCTTPANFFHLLRRQALRKIRKPLVVFTPKQGLRHPLAVSSLEELSSGAFQPLIPEQDKLASKVRRLILCSGKVYFDLLEARREKGIDDIAIVRVEELYPFPDALLQAEYARYPDAEVCWVQEEPRNMGAWPVYCDWLREQLPTDRQPRYIGRPPAASPAPGYKKISQAAELRFLTEALA
ncbi:MAG: 2-oxoglutarate dehydrogenase E1 component [Myxococcota bacterium]|nr:2-oxoglutarate dehydrogenase E1 component [Myxococcota bacterium]